jgi:hypothetical protein
MFGKRETVRFEIGGADIGKYFQQDSTFSRAIQLSSSNAAWDIWVPPTVTNKFASAKFIWNVANADISAPVNVYIWFYYTVYYSGTSTKSCKLYGIIDNVANIFINDDAVISLDNTVSASTGYTVNIIPGLNYIKVLAWNSDSYANPAGLKLTIVDGATLIIATNSDWAYTISTNTVTTNTTGAAVFNR